MDYFAATGQRYFKQQSRDRGVLIFYKYPTAQRLLSRMQPLTFLHNCTSFPVNQLTYRLLITDYRLLITGYCLLPSIAG